MTPLNLCALCGEDFASLRMFDRHMVGKPSDRTRGCLTPAELRDAGYALDARGRWTDPEAAARVGEAFGTRQASRDA